MAKLVLAPTVLVMLVCFYGSAMWTVYISMTRSFLLPTYAFAGGAQYVRLFHTPRWQVAYGNMFLFGVLDIVGTGPDRNMLEKLADELGYASRVRFHGFGGRSAWLLLRARPG